MPNSGDPTSRKCFSGILSRLLCSGSLPTHPSEQFIESSIEKFGNQKHEKSLPPEDNIKQVVAKAASSPGVVARLMGLESFPTTPKERTLSDFFRSKSVNSIDFLSHFDPIKHGLHHHRRVRTSVSFRDQGINDDFTSIILRLGEAKETGGNGEGEEMFIRERPNVKYQDQEQGKKEKEKEPRRKNREYIQVSNRPGKNLEMEEERKSVPGKISPGSAPGNSGSQKKDFQGKTRVNLKERRPIIKGVNSKEELVGSKCVKKKRNKILAHKVHSKNKIHPEGIVPEVARGISTREELPFQTANSQSPYSSSTNSDDVGVRAINITGKNERKMKIKESCYYKRIVEEISMLTEEDVKENWVHGMVLKFEDFEEICQQFGQEILEVLLKQFVDELVLLFGTRNIYEEFIVLNL